MNEVKEFVIKIECDGDIDAWTMENLIADMLMDKVNCTECSYNVEQVKKENYHESERDLDI